MQFTLKLISLVALLGIMVPCGLFFGGLITLDQLKLTSLVATIVWFAVTPFWVGQSPESEAASNT